MFRDEGNVNSESDGINRSLLRLIPFITPYRKNFIIGVLLSLIGVGFILYQPIIFKHIIDHDFKNKDLDGITKNALLYLTLLILGGVTNAAAAIIVGRTGIVAINGLKTSLFEKILQLGLPWCESQTTGFLVSRIESDCQKLINLISSVAIRLVSPILFIFGALFVIAQNDLRLFGLVAMLLPILAAATYILFRTLRKRFREERRLYGNITSEVSELIPAARLLQTYGRSHWAEKRLQGHNQKHVNFFYRLMVIEYGFWSAFGFFEIIMTVIAFFLGTYWLPKGEISLGTLIMFAQYASMIFMPIIQLSEQLAGLQKAGGAADRIFQCFDEEPALQTPNFPKDLPNLKEDIHFNNISFAYEADDLVLQDINFSIPKGTSIALVGATGSGKSTIINLLTRLRDPKEGSIRLGSQDIKAFDLEAYRSKFGLVLQDLYLFPASLKDNLSAFREEISVSSIMNCAEQIGVKHIIEQKGGLEQVMSEGGKEFSQGERQLLSFARALILEPEFLVLDEASSSIDPGTELKIQNALKQLMQNRSTLIVAHRLSTIRSVDQILFLEKGKIIERGNHESLMKLDGKYAAYIKLQNQVIAKAS